MIDVPSLLKRAAEKSGYVRIRHEDKRAPADPTEICVGSYWGDMRSMFVLSSILLKRYKEQVKGSKYFVMVSWPGYEGLFPYVDEYWTIKDQSLLPGLYRDTQGFLNDSVREANFKRPLNWFFEDVVDYHEIKEFYNNGIQQKFWERFKHVKRSLPSVPSLAIMGEGLVQDMLKRQGPKIFIYPTTYVQQWHHGRIRWMRTEKKFWLALTERLLKEGVTPVVYRNFFAHDLSSELTTSCVYVADDDVLKVLGVMRNTGLVLDLFSGLSRLAIAARAPFVACVERAQYAGQREYEIDGLCCDSTLPREYIFAFPTIINYGEALSWRVNLFDGIMCKVAQMLEDIDKDSLPSTSESTVIVPYETVKKHKISRLGTRFIRVARD